MRTRSAKHPALPDPGKPLVFSLNVLPPFRLDYTAAVLQRMPHNGIDYWENGCYRRVVVLNSGPALVEVAQEGSPDMPSLRVAVHREGNIPEVGVKARIATLLERTLGVQRNLEDFYALSRTDERVGSLVQRFMGVKPPRFPTLFEAMVNALACQQVSLTVGILLLDRLARAYGRAFSEGAVQRHAFPLPEDLAQASPEEVKGLGFSGAKARALVELSQAVSGGKVLLEEIEHLSDGEAVEYLSSLRGVGPWSAEYILLRGLGRLHIFPGSDSGAQKGLQELFSLGARPDLQKVREIILRWRPYAGMLYFHLLLRKLLAQGLVP